MNSDVLDRSSKSAELIRTKRELKRGCSFVNDLRLRRAAGHEQFQLPARGVAAGGTGDCGQALGWRPWPSPTATPWPGWCAPIAAKETPELRFIVGARLDFTRAPSLLLSRPTARPMAGCAAADRRQAARDEGRVPPHPRRSLAHGEGQLLIAVPPDRAGCGASRSSSSGCSAASGARLSRRQPSLSRRRRQAPRAAGAWPRAGVPLVATNDVHLSPPERRPLQDVLTCIREGCTIAEAGFRLRRQCRAPSESRREEMARLFRDCPEAVARTLEIAARLPFSLGELQLRISRRAGARGPHAAGRTGAV